MSPVAVPALPLKLGSGLFVGVETGLRETAGGVMSTVKVDVALLPVFFASSDCSAWTV